MCSVGSIFAGSIERKASWSSWSALHAPSLCHGESGEASCPWDGLPQPPFLAEISRAVVHSASLEGLLCSRRASVLPGPPWGHGEGLGSNRSPAAVSSGRASLPLQPSVLLPAALTAGICLAARLGDPGLRCHSGHTLSPMSLMSCLGCRFALIRSASESSAEPEPFSLSFN